MLSSSFKIYLSFLLEMINKLIYILLFATLFSSGIIDNTGLIIADMFPQNLSINHSIYHLDKTDIKTIQNKVRQKFFRDELNIWEIVSKDTTHYYAILDNVKGKSLPITFLAIYNDNGEIFDTQIIKYREAYGGEIKSKSWLRQFLNYNDSSNYNVGNAIDGISGATISVKSVTKGIHKLSILIHKLIKDLNEK